MLFTVGDEIVTKRMSIAQYLLENCEWNKTFWFVLVGWLPKWRARWTQKFSFMNISKPFSSFASPIYRFSFSCFISKQANSKRVFCLWKPQKWNFCVGCLCDNKPIRGSFHHEPRNVLLLLNSFIFIFCFSSRFRLQE